MMCHSDSDLDRLIEDDVPSGDLTASLLGIGAAYGRLELAPCEETALGRTEDYDDDLQTKQ